MTFQDAVMRLSNHLIYQRSGKMYTTGWVGVECPFHAQPSKSKLYVSIPKNEEGNVILKCFKPSCEVARSVKEGDLEKLGFMDKEAIKIIYEHNRNNRTTKFSSRYSDGDRLGLYIPNNPEPEVAKYFRDRTRYELSTDYIQRFSVVSNMSEFCVQNTNVLSPETIRHLNSLITNNRNQLIGFLNKNHNKLSIRGTSPGSTIKLNLDLITTDHKLEPYYIYSGNIDDDSPRNLVISEGPFDILNAYLNYVGLPNCEYVACLGSNLNADLLKRITFGNEYHTIVLIVDGVHNDKTKCYEVPKEHINRACVRVLNHVAENIYIVYNENGKDLGDMRDVHRPRKERIK
ncbi:MAG: hypothetical protein ACRCX2_38890 [Paraclostridium sp.]